MSKILYIAVAICLFCTFSMSFDIQSLNDKRLEAYCKKCHIVYPAGLMPSRSWKKLFSDESLSSHFGESVSLSDDVKKDFLAYYLKYASDISDNKLARKINKSINPSSTPLRISKIPYIEDKHKDLTKEMVILNPKVESFSYCKSCHGAYAQKGEFEEDDVKIPNYKKVFLLGWIKDD